MYIGELRPHKNIDRLIKGFSLFRATTPHAHNVKLYIAGSQHVSYTLPKPLPENVEYRGRVSEQELVRLYRGAIAVCFVSLYEGFGLPILEAMLHRTPVITSNISSMPEIAGNAALLTDPTHINEIGRAMQRLYISPKLRAALIARGAMRAREFSWHKAAIETHAVYEQVLA